MKRKVLCRVDGCDRGMFVETVVKRWGTKRVFLICGVHWRRLTKTERRVAHRLNRLAKRYGTEEADDRAGVVWRALAKRAGEADRIGRESGL